MTSIVLKKSLKWSQHFPFNAANSVYILNLRMSHLNVFAVYLFQIPYITFNDTI